MIPRKPTVVFFQEETWQNMMQRDVKRNEDLRQWVLIYQLEVLVTMQRVVLLRELQKREHREAHQLPVPKVHP